MTLLHYNDWRTIVVIAFMLMDPIFTTLQAVDKYFPCLSDACPFCIMCCLVKPCKRDSQI